MVDPEPSALNPLRCLFISGDSAIDPGRPPLPGAPYPPSVALPGRWYGSDDGGRGVIGGRM